MINLEPKSIYNEYTLSVDFKNSLGDKGLYEQTDINERFFAGDQWYGAKCGNSRPLVRHNVIKRIGDFKLSQILGSGVDIDYSVDGTADINHSKTSLKKRFSGLKLKGELSSDEIAAVREAFNNYFSVTALRTGLDGLCAKVLRNAYISGTGIIYTYWDPDVKTGIIKNSVPVTGDIKCEVLNVKNVYFASPFEENIEAQPYIIIASVREEKDVRYEAEKYGADEFTIKNIKGDRNGKILVLTKLYKERKEDGSETVMCVKVTEKATVRPAFDTLLRRYPLSVFKWEERSGLVYGESEITYLIPNQIAINRMITANVWASILSGMPMMVINGDTVTGEITNEPGQVVKVYGTNEDVEGAIKYVTPPDSAINFGNNVNMLIENTLVQSGANEVALGDSRADNMSALNAMRKAAVMPLELAKNRYLGLVCDIALTWADFWITQYKQRKIKVYENGRAVYIPFNADRYKDLSFSATAKEKTQKTDSEKTQLLLTLFDKGVISKAELIKRLPDGLIDEKEELFCENKEEKGEEK